MISYQDLEDRIASLERQVRNLGIGQELVLGNLHVLDKAVVGRRFEIGDLWLENSHAGMEFLDVDTIDEFVSGSGVTIDSVLLKDGDVKVAGGLVFVRADKDSDGDYDPLTSTSWDGDSFSDAATGTINWNTAFGVPTTAKAVALWVQCRDSAAAYYHGITFKAKSTTTNNSFEARLLPNPANDEPVQHHGIVPIQSDGTSYYAISASGASTLDVWIRVIGWYV